MENDLSLPQPVLSANVSLDKTSKKSSVVITRLNSLHEKINQGEYSPRNILKVVEPCIDTKTALKIVLSTSLFMISSQLRRDDHLNLIITKLLWIMALFSYFYLYPPKSIRSLQKQLSVFFALRLLSSSIAYSIVTGFSFTYDMHIESQEHDIIVNLFLTMAVALFLQRDLLAIRACLTLQFIGYVFIVCALQFWFKRFDSIIILHQIALFLSLIIFCQLLGTRSSMDRDLIQATMNKHCEHISQELNEIKNRIEEEESNFIAASSSLNTSKVDELVRKIKYLKFTLLQKEKEKTFLNARPVFTNVRRRTYITKNPGPHSPYGYSNQKAEEEAQHSLELKHSTSIPNVDRKNDLEAKWRISADDCDSLVKLILEKQVIMWYPEVLKAKESQVNRETAEYLKQHFTEVGNSLLQLNFNDEPKQPSFFESKNFECSSWSNYLEAHICTWNFDTLKFKELTNGNHMIEFGCGIMKKFDILKTLNTTPSVALSFLRDISDAYLPNPYHNSIHGVDVGNAVGYFLAQKEFGGNFTQLEISCLVISALAHDLGHPGLNNAFLVATMSTEALLYNDQSVLENFHSASLFKILQKTSSNIIQNLSEKDYKFFRKLSINLILDTDLTKHFIILSKFKNNIDALNLKEETDRSLSLSIALKCADVCHGAKELGLHKRWSRRIAEEFFNQGDKEREYNIPVTPSCDRAGNISKGQHGFLTFIVLPLFEALDQRFFTEEMRETVTNQIRKNLKYWQDEIPKEEQGENNFMKETEKILEDIAIEARSAK